MRLLAFAFTIVFVWTGPKSFVVISFRPLRTMWANYPKIEFIPAVSEERFAFVRSRCR